MFVVVNGVPSVGISVMVGSGKIEAQATQSAVSLPESYIPTKLDTGNNNNNGGGGKQGAAAHSSYQNIWTVFAFAMMAAFMMS